MLFMSTNHKEATVQLTFRTLLPKGLILQHRVSFFALSPSALPCFTRQAADYLPG